jgi:acetamidase/formamidase
MVEWLVADDKLEKWDAYETLSQLAQIRVGDMVDANYAVVVKMPKCYLPH